MTDPGTILRAALSRDAQTIMEATGLSATRCLQAALELSRDPAVALEHPVLVAAVRERIEAGRRRRERPAAWR